MYTKTGTTIVGIKYCSGVILCADTRSTSGPVVSNKNCIKIHTIGDQIMCAGAGTAADTDRVTRMAEKELRLFECKYLKKPYLSHAVRLISKHLHMHQGHIGAALIMGGIDNSGVYLFDIHPHGSYRQCSYTSLGSGSLAAISVLESGFRQGMSRDEAIALGCDAIKAGILNDLYSGSNVDVCIVSENGVELLRNYVVVSARNDTDNLVYPLASVRILSEEIIEYKLNK